MANNQVVAIDIGSATAKIAHIEKTSGVLRLLNSGVMTYTDPDNPANVSETIRSLWNQIGINRNFFNRHRIDIAVTIPRLFVVSKALTNLPSTTTDIQLPTMIDMAAETELPFQKENSVFTYHDVKRSPDSLSVELLSTRRDTVARYMDVLNEIGLTPSAVVPSMLAISTVAGQALSDSDARTIIVDIGAGHSDFCIMQGETLQFSRGFTVSGNQLTRTLMTEMDLDPDSAEEEKEHIPANQPPTRTWTRRFIAELERSISAAERENITGESEDIAEIWLCGGGARVPELAETCQEQLQIPTRLWNPITTGALEIDTAATELNSYGDSFAVPLGMGIHVLDTEKPVSLLPTEVGVKHVESSRKHQQLIAAGIAAVLIVIVAVCSITWSRSQKSKEDNINNMIATYQGLQANANKQLSLELILADKLTHQVTPIDVLNVFSTLFKDRTKVAWKTFEVNNLDDFNKTRITFSLQANEHRSINSMLGVLSDSGLFRDIDAGEVTTTGDERRPTFEVKINCKLTNQAAQKLAQRRHPKPQIELIEEEVEEIDVSPPENTNLENGDVEAEEDEAAE